jgi:hypothetical protein
VKILRWQIGDATILRIGEVDATVALQGLIPMLNSADISRAPWLRPDFVDEMGRLRGLVQAFLIMVGSQTIVVDPGVGNGKTRVAVPGWDNLHTDFFGRFRASGVEPSGIDYVVNTHLHFDHVGWHTHKVDGAWQPTFPAARYVISAEEFRYWQSVPKNQIADQHAGFADSVLPVYQAGLVDLAPLRGLAGHQRPHSAESVSGSGRYGRGCGGSSDGSVTSFHRQPSESDVVHDHIRLRQHQIVAIACIAVRIRARYVKHTGTVQRGETVGGSPGSSELRPGGARTR